MSMKKFLVDSFSGGTKQRLNLLICKKVDVNLSNVGQLPVGHSRKRKCLSFYKLVFKSNPYFHFKDFCRSLSLYLSVNKEVLVFINKNLDLRKKD